MYIYILSYRKVQIHKLLVLVLLEVLMVWTQYFSMKMVHQDLQAYQEIPVHMAPR